MMDISWEKLEDLHKGYFGVKEQVVSGLLLELKKSHDELEEKYQALLKKLDAKMDKPVTGASVAKAPEVKVEAKVVPSQTPVAASKSAGAQAP